MKNILNTIRVLIQYNMKVIFAGKFVWFIFSAFLFFAFFMINNVTKGNELNEAMIYDILFFPGILLIFYPSVFGIQNDEDSKILEILFGIPNYRYKVWLLRLGIIYIAIGFILVAFAYVANYLMYPVPEWSMVMRLMLPMMFVGNLSFMLSTIVRNGNGTAVVLIILMIAIFFMISSDTFGIKTSFWNVMLNPYKTPDGVHPSIWESTMIKNIIFLVISDIVFVLVGLLNLQKREKFV